MDENKKNINEINHLEVISNEGFISPIDAVMETEIKPTKEEQLKTFASENNQISVQDKGSDSCNVQSQDADEVKREKNLIMKNVILISIAFLITFTSYIGLSRLQSSIHRDEGIGVITQSVLYGCLLISCLFLPKLMISTVGHKWTLPISFSGYILWMAANGYAVWGTMIAGVIMVGIAAAPLWTAQSSYFTIAAARYAKLTGETDEAVLTRFFGIFFCLFQMSGITGSIISSVILTPEDQDYVPDESVLEYCGRNDCPGVNISNPALTEPSEATVWTLVGIYIGIAVMAVFMTSVFIDPLPDRYKKREKVHLADITGLVLASGKHMRNKRQFILIPITIYIGLQQTFNAADFNASFVTCPVGIWKVGLVTIGYGLVNAIVSFTSGRVVKHTGRLPIFLAGFVVDLSSQITLMLWMPHPRQQYVLYLLTCLRGFSDAIWQTQINALYGVIFASDSEAAFSNYRIWESVGFIIGFAYSAFLCTSTKLYIQTSILVLGFAGYLIVEYKQSKKKQLEITCNI